MAAFGLMCVCVKSDDLLHTPEGHKEISFVNQFMPLSHCIVYVIIIFDTLCFSSDIDYTWQIFIINIAMTEM